MKRAHGKKPLRRRINNRHNLQSIHRSHQMKIIKIGPDDLPEAGKRNNYSFAESLALYGFTESKKGSSIYPCVIPPNPLRRLLDRLIASIVHIVVNELTIKGGSRYPEKS